MNHTRPTAHCRDARFAGARELPVRVRSSAGRIGPAGSSTGATWPSALNARNPRLRCSTKSPAVNRYGGFTRNHLPRRCKPKMRFLRKRPLAGGVLLPHINHFSVYQPSGLRSDRRASLNPSRLCVSYRRLQLVRRSRQQSEDKRYKRGWLIYRVGPAQDATGMRPAIEEAPFACAYSPLRTELRTCSELYGTSNFGGMIS